MVGANYMGGKRNAVRSKGKDKDAGLQRNFFGKQRLHILSKGLLSSRPDASGAPGEASSKHTAGIADIPLAHARQKIPQRNRRSGASWIPEPAYIPMCSSPVKGLKRLRAHTSTPETKTKSKILQTLDVSEPNFLRHLLDRIKRTPDLAGLERQGKAEPTGSQRWTHKAGAKADATSHSSREESPEPSMLHTAHDEFCEAWDRYPGSPSFPAAGHSESMSPEYQHHWSAPSFSSMEIPESSIDQPYFDHHSEEMEVKTSSSRRPFQLPSSPPTSIEKAPVEPGAWQPARSDDVAKYRSQNSVYNASEPGSPSTTDRQFPRLDNAFDERGLPSVIQFPQPSDRYAPTSYSVYGTLFQHQAPWVVIGEILDRGQRQEDTTWESGGTLAGAALEDADGECAAALRGAGSHEGDYEEEEVDIGVGKEDDEKEYAGLFRAFEGDFEEFEQEPMDAMDQDSFEVNYDSDHQDTKADEWSRVHSPTTQECLIQLAPPSPISELAEDDSLLATSTHIPRNPVTTGDANAETVVWPFRSVISPMFDPSYDEELREAQSEMMDTACVEPAKDSPDLLSTPELEEVNGRYLGPSLFDDESDDEL